MVAYPKDWELKKIGELLTVQTGIRDLKDKVQEGKYPFYVRSNIIEKINSYDFNTEAVLTAGDGNIGEVFHYINGKFSAHQRVYVIHNFNKVQGKFFYYWFSNSFIKQAMKFTAKATVDSIRKPTITEMSLPVPSISEQQAIADTLSTFDEHIENLTELIEKKKVIRDGALEDLVTGKVRLDEFDGEWETVEFSRYFRKMKNNTFPRDNLTDNGDIGNIHYGDVLIKFGPVLDDEKVIPRVKPSVSITNPDYLQENDIVIADTAEDETVGKAVQIGSISIPLVSGLHTIPCRPNFETAPGFLGYYINSNAYHSQLLPHITGIKVSSVSKKSIDTTYLHIPKDIKEQQAIASVLTAMDEELDNLELEKEKLLQMKAGAMDDLLTGKIRLV